MNSTTLSFTSLYTSGDIVLQDPVESSSVLVMIVVISAALKYLFGLAQQVRSKFFHRLLRTLADEILVFGSLSLLLTLGASLVSSLPSKWSIMISWTHVCLLFTGLLFVCLLIVSAVRVIVSARRWANDDVHEKKKSSQENCLSDAAEAFRDALSAFGYPTDLPFAPYRHRAEKEVILSAANLSWKSWLSLTVVIVINAGRTKIIANDVTASGNLNTTGDLVDVVTYVALIGYGTLALFVAVYLRLQRRLRQFLDSRPRHATAVATGEAGTSDTWLPTKSDLHYSESFLLWQSRGLTIDALQVVIMSLSWYAGAFFIDMVYPAFVALNAGLAILLIVVAAVPIVVFVTLIPWTITTVAMLSSLGNSIREAWVSTQQNGALVDDGVGSAAAELKRAKAEVKEPRPALPLASPRRSTDHWEGSGAIDAELDVL